MPDRTRRAANIIIAHSCSVGMGLPSHRSVAGWVQTPPTHTSLVHVLPSSAHGVLSGLARCEQTPARHASTEHSFPSPHGVLSGAGGWAQTPPRQMLSVHGFPSSVHGTLSWVPWSGGQFGPLPGQNSAGLHSPPDGRHSTVFGWNRSGGHAVLCPSHTSSMSQTPAEGRHTCPWLAGARSHCWVFVLQTP